MDNHSDKLLAAAAYKIVEYIGEGATFDQAFDYLRESIDCTASAVLGLPECRESVAALVGWLVKLPAEKQDEFFSSVIGPKPANCGLAN